MNKAILILGHGSRYPYNKAVMELQKQRLESMGFTNIYIGFNETSHPSIQEAMHQIAADGADEVVAMPFFIASGLHMVRDIPPKLGLEGDAADQTVSVDGHKIRVRFGTPFMDDPVLAEVLCGRIEESRRCRNTGILVIGHGSKLPYNKQIISLNASRLSEAGYENVLYAFNEFDEPLIEDQMKALSERGADEIIALPLFISTGDHLKNDIPPKIGLSDGNNEGIVRIAGRDVRVFYAMPLGEDPRLTDVFAEKIRTMAE